MATTAVHERRKIMSEVTGEGHSKCLLLGGYLVLSRESTALCISLAPKVVCRAVPVKTDHGFQVSVETIPRPHSFVFSRDTILNPGPFDSKFERFVLAAIHVVFSVFPFPDFSISMSVQGDKEFYSDSGKTGLGSSAATVVAVVRALQQLLGAPDDANTFKLASVAHSLAQGHIGSCFDISCAVFGTQIFRRPTPSLLSIDCLKAPWDNEWQSVVIPKTISIVLLATSFDGSSTPGLVKMFQEKAKLHKETYEVLKAAVDAAIQVFRRGDIESMRKAFRDVRAIQRQITLEWGVGIVPDEVDKICNEVEQLDGVVAAVVPGAGGYDAIAVVTDRREIGFATLGLTILATT